MTWGLALNNLNNTAVDDRITCKCGTKFVPKQKNSKYCSATCKDEASAERKRKPGKARFSFQHKPLEECGDVQRKFRIRAAYFNAMFSKLSIRPLADGPA